MLLRSAMQARWRELEATGEDLAELPRRLKADPLSVRPAMMRRLAATRFFAWGDKAGSARTAGAAGSRPFRLDRRQRVVVKALVSRHGGARGRAVLAAHVRYLGRAGTAQDGGHGAFFDQARNGVEARDATAEWTHDRHHFRFIISPEHGDRIADLRAYVREVMGRVAADLREPDLCWLGVCHFDTDQPHAHVLVRGRRQDGRDLVIPRAYIAYGFRSRAREAAQERLGDLSRIDAERRVWRDTQADRFTPLDRRLVATADEAGRVVDGIGGSDAWSALIRGRLRHLERLGLATRESGRFRLAPDLERQLRALQVRRDVIRTLHQRRLEGAREVRLAAEPGRLRGRVTARGFHEEIGGAPWIVVRDAAGVERLVGLRTGAERPRVGSMVELEVAQNGLGAVLGSRGADLAR